MSHVTCHMSHVTLQVSGGVTSPWVADNDPDILLITFTETMGVAMILTIDDPNCPDATKQSLDNEGLDGVLRVRLTLVGPAAYCPFCNGYNLNCHQ